jgi:cytochrome P450
LTVYCHLCSATTHYQFSLSHERQVPGSDGRSDDTSGQPTVTQQPPASLYRPLLGAQDTSLAAHPRAAYERLRTSAPVQSGGVIVSTRREVQEVLWDSENYSSAGAPRLGGNHSLAPLELDPPTHNAFRVALEPLFSPARVVELTKTMTCLAGELLDDLVDESEIDFATRFSVPFPAQVLVALLGLPLDDLAWLLDLKDGVIRPNRALGKPLDDPEVIAYQITMTAAAYDYFGEALDRRAKDQTDDLLSDLLRVEVDGQRLNRDQLLAVSLCLLIEGIDPVSAALDCMFASLAECGTLRAQVLANPRAAVEELLRWETPVMYVVRTATADTSLGGCPIQAGQRVFALLGSANLDPAEFSDAEMFQPQRRVNRHLAFGTGIHRCLGSHLARMELSVALREWHARFPDYSVSRRVELGFTPGVRTVEQFPMRLGR